MDSKDISDEKQRLTALLVFLAAYCEGIRKPLGLTMLNKLLYYIDFGHYALHQKPITQLHYSKDQYGPVPNTVADEVGELVRQGVLTARSHRYHTVGKVGMAVGTAYTKDSPILLEVFDADEMQTIVKTVEALTTMTPTQISKRSHDDYTWLHAQMHGPIPLEDAKFCDFEWLDYLADGQTTDEIERNEQLRHELEDSPEIRAIMSKIAAHYRSRPQK